MSTVDNPAAAGPGAAATHAVTNQSEPLAGYNVFTADRALVEAVSREGGDYEIETIRAVGDLAGRAETLELGRSEPEVVRRHLLRPDEEPADRDHGIASSGLTLSKLSVAASLLGDLVKN